MSETMPSESGIDIIPSLAVNPFKVNPPEVRHQILQRGRPKPILAGKEFNQNLHGSWYELHPWLCGSAQLNKLFCWPCLLMRPESSSWCSTGVVDVKKIIGMAAKHSTSKSHLKAIAEFDGTLLEAGLSPQFTKETSAQCKAEQSRSDSDSDQLGSFLSSKRRHPENPQSRDRSMNDGPARQTLTFHAWQQASRARVETSDPKLSRRKRRLARIEINNAELTAQKLRLEIQLLECKLELQRALNASVAKDKSGTGET